MSVVVAMTLAAMAPAVGRPTIPPRFRGEWQRAITQCGGDQEDTLRISARRLAFYEATFDPATVHHRSPRALIAQGVWHEGTTVRARLALTLSGDRKHLVVRSPRWTSHLVKCS